MIGKNIKPPMPSNSPSSRIKVPPLAMDTTATVLEQSLGTAFIQALASLANEDDVISPAEYEAILRTAQEMDESNLAALIALKAIDSPKNSADALTKLRSATTTLSEVDRANLFRLGWPLVELQCERAKDVATRLAKSLRLPVNEQQMQLLSRSAAPPIWKDVTLYSLRRLKGRDALAHAAQAIRHCGDPKLASVVTDYLEGAVELRALEAQRTASLSALREQIQTFTASLQTLGEDIDHRKSILAYASELVEQIEQRVAVFSARVELEKTEFDDEFDDLVHDAGNAFELELKGQMEDGSWKAARFWDRIAKGPFARELERRLDRIGRRYSERLVNLQQEAVLFSKEYQIVSGRLLKRMHHSSFAKAMPGLRMKTKVLEQLDSGADLAVKGSMAMGVGAGAAMYFFGATAMLPLIVPAAPYMAGAFLIGALIKKLVNVEGLAQQEAAGKREAFEKELRLRLTELRAKLFTELDAVQSAFSGTAQAIAVPTMAEAKAQLEIVQLQQIVGQRIIQTAGAYLSKASTTSDHQHA